MALHPLEIGRMKRLICDEQMVENSVREIKWCPVAGGVAYE